MIHFIKNRLSGVEHLFIIWFCGEPLLGMQVIENLSKQIIEICNEKNIEYSASIITNGYLLDKCTAEKLKEYQVKAVQITVDGPKELHDARRPMIDGRGTYDAIIKNLIEIQNDFIIALRINVDIDNICAADKIIYNLRSLVLVAE